MVRLQQSRVVFLGLGVILGIVLARNVEGLWPHVPLHATATQTSDSFAIATGFADDQTEAIFFLDFLTGDLKAAVLHPQSRKFNAFFQYNILEDFGTSDLKNPKYSMVTGVADIQRAGRTGQLGKSVVYISEATTGQLAVYAIPFSTTLQAQRKSQSGPFIPLDKRTFRTTIIRGSDDE